MAEKQLIIFLDSGDTLIDESTEIRDEHDIVLTAQMIPGAKQMLQTLHERGYTIALVADGYAQSFRNMFLELGIYDYFTAMINSENIKYTKPSARMFKAAVGALDLSEKDYHRIIMVGNNLSRDIKGANELGITSILLNWTPRYPKDPADASERPDYIIEEPLDLLELVETLNDKLVSQQA